MDVCNIIHDPAFGYVFRYFSAAFLPALFLADPMQVY